MADVQNSSALEKRIKKHVIGKPHRFMAVAPLGFEETLAEELKYIGVEVTSDGTPGSKCANASGLNSTANTSSENCAAGIKVAGDGKVEFTAKITEAWKAVAYCRIANRVLMEIGCFKAENFGQLEKGTAAVPWELYLPVCHSERSVAKSINETRNFSSLVELGSKEQNLDIHVTCKHSRLYHSGAIEERVAPIIAKALAGSNPDSYPQNLYVNLQDDRCTLWLDLAGEELYKRGHERFVAEAPLKETIAAAMIFEAVRFQAIHQSSSVRQTPSCDNHQLNIVDPMAGSGTFSLEAAYIANGLIPGKCRDFALKHQPAFKEGTWNYLLKAADSTQCHPERSGAESINETRNFSSLVELGSKEQNLESTQNILRIITSDISERPISIIKHNAEASPLAEIAKTNPNAVTINPQLKDFFSYTIDDICAVRPSANDTARDIVILLNPPYGKRLAFDAPKLYTKIGQKLGQLSRDAQSCGASITVAILAPKDDTRGGAHYTCTENLL
ncbi:MAG: hypothetical protein MJZ26_13100, partial [Fibrobacter sp.]|nr:hypothetical protein [Fibrobacter sp.]